MYAIVNLESHKYQVSIVGENLGIVPRYVNTTMDRHRLKRMYILPFEIRPEWHAALRPVADNAVASLNTHDMAPFAAFCQGLDIADRVDRHLLTPEEASGEQQGRQGQLHALKHFLQQQGLLDMPDAELSALLSACLAFLSASEAQVVLVNLEDLWLDTQQQNYPGTVHERPNWQQKARYGLDVFRHMPQVLALLRSINYLRKQGNVPG
jgi:4-alpha-glucanotransferase